MATREDIIISFFDTEPKTIKKEAKAWLKTMMAYIDSTEVARLEELYKSCKYIRYAAKDYLDESKVSGTEKDLLTSIGYTNALIDVMQLYTEQKFEECELKKINTKYKYPILKILAEKGTLLHKDLASLLGVTPSGLTAVIQKMNATSVKVINIEEISKYKLYSLTALAYKYYLQNNWDEPMEVTKPENRNFTFVYRDAGNHLMEYRTTKEKEPKTDFVNHQWKMYEKRNKKYKEDSLKLEVKKSHIIVKKPA